MSRPATNAIVMTWIALHAHEKRFGWHQSAHWPGIARRRAVWLFPVAANMVLLKVSGVPIGGPHRSLTPRCRSMETDMSRAALISTSLERPSSEVLMLIASLSSFFDTFPSPFLSTS